VISRRAHRDIRELPSLCLRSTLASMVGSGTSFGIAGCTDSAKHYNSAIELAASIGVPAETQVAVELSKVALA